MLIFVAFAITAAITCLTLCAVMLKGSLATPEQVAMEDLEQMRSISRNASRTRRDRDEGPSWRGGRHPTSHGS